MVDRRMRVCITICCRKKVIYFSVYLIKYSLRYLAKCLK
jgi:hypothetical protein